MILAQDVGLMEVVVVLLYLAAVVYLGWLGYRRTQSTTDYLVAGRKAHPFIMAMSYGATFISTSAIVGFGGVSGLFGMSLLWLTVCNIFVGIFVAFVLLGGPTRRMGHRLDAHTFPELIGRRYDSKFLQVFAGLIIFVFMPLYAAAVIIGGTEFIASAFKVDYHMALLVLSVIVALYVLTGGMKAVMYTDALQGVIMFVGMTIFLVWAYWNIGGVAKGHEDLTAMKAQAFGGFKALGFNGWTEMPKFGFGKPEYDLWWIVVSTLVMGVGIGVLAQPQLVVRFMTVKSKRELNRAVPSGGVFILMMTGVAFTVGTLTNVYFYKHEKVVGTLVRTTAEAGVIVKKEPGQPPVRMPCKLIHIDTGDDGVADVDLIAEGLGEKPSKLMPKAEIRDLGEGKIEVMPRATSFTRALIRKGEDWMLNPDSIIPTYVTSAMPRWFGVLFLVTLLAAAMSTISSQFHTAGTALGRDVFEQIIGTKGDEATSQRSANIVRIGMIIGIIIAVIFAYQARGGYIIARATAIFFGMCGAAFLPAFIGGLFWRGMTKQGAIASMITGCLVSTFWLVFVKAAEAGAIGLVLKLTENKSSLLWKYPNWPVVDPMFVAMPISIFVAVVVSLFTKRPSEQHLERCFGADA